MAEARDLRKDIVGSQNQHFPHSEKESRFDRRRSSQTHEIPSSESEKTVGASKQCNKMFMSVFCLFLFYRLYCFTLHFHISYLVSTLVRLLFCFSLLSFAHFCYGSMSLLHGVHQGLYVQYIGIDHSCLPV